ncbi:sensor histidine kinase [Frateuria defendens]|uniref:sensor histidine kinase n=1 Tax=Frateuria defendens TaxID=2219559 RepID=UPI0007DC088F|nr:sensor histidine kinase [Frateuria defendens]
METLRQLPARWFKPAPDSAMTRSVHRGRSMWTESAHLLWSFWVFVVPVFNSEGWSLRWAVLTATSYPLFLWLFFKALAAPRRYVIRYALVLVLLGMLLAPWYPSALTYFVYGCVLLCSCSVPLWRYMAWLLVLNTAMWAECMLLHYAWQSLVSIPITTVIVGLIVNAERLSNDKEVELRLSQEEVRRLAATAERERIGRDLHDLLGHTLSLITLKLELSRRLFDRDSEAARREMEEAEQVARHALAEVRAAVTGIRATDLAAELASARLLLGASGVHLDYAPPPPGLPADTERALALLLREAVTNVARHAEASRAWVHWAREGAALRVTVADDGRGGITQDGNGLCGMRERVRALGGMLEIDSPRGQGTRLRIQMPVPVTVMREQAAQNASPKPADDIAGKAIPWPSQEGQAL